MIKETPGGDMIIGRGPVAIAGHGSPTTIGTTPVERIGRIAPQGAGRTLPKHGVGGIPTGAGLILFQVLEHQVMAVDINDVK